MPAVFQPVDSSACEDLTCVVCLDPWRNPIELQPCGHIFCQACVGAQPKRCHMCRGNVTGTKEPNRILVNMAADVIMRCSGCGFECANKKRHEHQGCTGTGGGAGGGGGARSTSPAAIIPTANANAPYVNMLPLQQQQQQQHQLSSPPPHPPSHNQQQNHQGYPNVSYADDNNSVNNRYSQQPPPQQQQQHHQLPLGSSNGPGAQYGLTDAEYDHTMAIFMTFDTDDSNSLDKPELTRLARYLNFAHERRDIDSMFAQMANPRTHKVDLHSFCTWLSQHRPDPQALYGMSAMEYHEALFQFHSYDADNSGLIDKSEFRRLATRMGYASSAQESDQLFMAIDTDGSGEIDLHELLTFISQRKQSQRTNVVPPGWQQQQQQQHQQYQHQQQAPHYPHHQHQQYQQYQQYQQHQQQQLYQQQHQYHQQQPLPGHHQQPHQQQHHQNNNNNNHRGGHSNNGPCSQQ